MNPSRAHPAYPTAPAETTSRPLIALLGGAALALLAGWLLIALYLYFRFSGPIAPGVRVGETLIGGLTIEQAAARIDNDWNRERVLVVTDGINYWQARPLDFGLWVDPAATARQAYQIGRGERRWSEWADLIFNRAALEAPPALVFSPTVAVQQLRLWRGLVERAPANPDLRLVDGQWQAVPGAPGAALDVEQTVRLMENNAAVIARSGVLQLITQPLPSPVTELEARLPELQALLARPLRVQGYDPIRDQSEEWDVPPETLAQWLRVEWAGGEPRLRIDESGFPAYLDGLQARLGDGRAVWLPPKAYNLTERWQSGAPYTVILRHPPTSYTVQPGDTLLSVSYRVQLPAWMILRANPGLNPDLLPAGSTLAIPSKSDLLPLPVVVGKRIVIAIGAQRMSVHENGSLLREFVISTGIDRSPTQPGVFQVQTRDE
ncbi:MAG: LysM peptidoglycan-binding domain-containing protein, partial [Chloroflexota bacterium]